MAFIVVAEVVGRLEGDGLQPLTERIPVLKRDADQIARATDGPRGRLELDQGLGVVRRAAFFAVLTWLPLAAARIASNGASSGRPAEPSPWTMVTLL